jgi:hypothetical protein
MPVQRLHHHDARHHRVGVLIMTETVRSKSHTAQNASPNDELKTMAHQFIGEGGGDIVSVVLCVGLAVSAWWLLS